MATEDAEEDKFWKSVDIHMNTGKIIIPYTQKVLAKRNKIPTDSILIPMLYFSIIHATFRSYIFLQKCCPKVISYSTSYKCNKK